MDIKARNARLAAMKRAAKPKEGSAREEASETPAFERTEAETGE